VLESAGAFLLGGDGEAEGALELVAAGGAAEKGLAQVMKKAGQGGGLDAEGGIAGGSGEVGGRGCFHGSFRGDVLSHGGGRRGWAKEGGTGAGGCNPQGFARQRGWDRGDGSV
jgi:hypothetical protein